MGKKERKLSKMQLKEPAPSVPNNIKLKVDRGTLFIEVDLEKEIGISSSGKTMVVGTSKGSLLLYPFADADEDKERFGSFRLNLSVYKPRIK